MGREERGERERGRERERKEKAVRWAGAGTAREGGWGEEKQKRREKKEESERGERGERGREREGRGRETGLERECENDRC